MWGPKFFPASFPRDRPMLMLAPLLRLITCCLLLAGATPLMASGAMPDRQTRPERAALPLSVTRALQEAGIPLEAVSIVVQDVTTERPQLSFNALQPRNPASLMKLVTSWAALDMLGPDYRWQTEIAARTLPHDGVLQDDLYFIGGGDPHLDVTRFWLLLRALRARGVRDIRGDLVLVLPDEVPHTNGSSFEFDGQGLRPYNVLPYALLMNFGIQRLILQPAGDRVRVSSEPPSANLQIDNQLRLLPEGTACGDWRSRVHASTTPINDGLATRLTLQGTYAQQCAEQDWYLHSQPGGQFLAGVFQLLWQELGGSHHGQWRETSVRPPDLTTLLTQSSLPLVDVLRPLNKYSNNVMARHVFLTLGRTDSASAPGAEPARDAAILQQRATRRLKDWLQARHIQASELVMDNGAGLSRQAQLSAASLNQLLQSAWRDPLMPDYVSMLPLAGVDGTLRKRFTQGPLRARAYLKTGSLDNASGLAGFVTDHRGHWHSLVFLINHPRAQASRAAQDALLLWLHRQEP